MKVGCEKDDFQKYCTQPFLGDSEPNAITSFFTGGCVERRKFPRQDVRGSPLKATLVLTGGSLLNSATHNAVEIDAHPLDLSQGGIRLSLGLKAHWATFSPQREIDLFLVGDEGRRKPFKATVIRFLEQDHELSLEFRNPQWDVAEFTHKPSLN
jgi:hypothetical protein